MRVVSSIKLLYLGCDRYHRIVGGLLLNGTLYVEEESVRRGAAWFNSEYPDRPELYKIENDARGAKLGHWALPRAQHIEPWVWRKMSTERRDAVRGLR